MFQKKIDMLFNGKLNECGIPDDIPIVGFGELCRDHDATLDKVLRICRLANMKINKDRCCK